MKIAVVGNFAWAHYQQALVDGLSALGEALEISKIKLKYYPSVNLAGILLNSIKLIYYVIKIKPNVVFLYRVDYIFPLVCHFIKKIKCCKLLIYHNDDPYKKTQKNERKYFFFLRTLKYADIVYVYRDINIPEAKEWGAHVVKVLRSHYYTKQDFVPDLKISIDQKLPRIVYIGHYEDDNRVDCIDALYTSGINLHIFGDYSVWSSVFIKHNWPLQNLHEPVFADKYRMTLHDSYAALAFFSQKNRDDYTRRCFEIPIAGTLLITPKTKYTERIFSDHINALLFSSSDEIVDKSRFVLSNPEEVETISKNGYELILNGGFSEIDFAKQIMNDITFYYIYN